jgi:glutamine amidotransferase
MALSSDEDGISNGLGFIEANVKKFDIKNLKIPHVGFNQVRFNGSSILYDGLENLSDFYFTHSYQMQSDIDINQSICEYGNEFIVSYEVDNIAGVQFHPELSQTNGLKLLDNFIKRF